MERNLWDVGLDDLFWDIFHHHATPTPIFGDAAREL
jgi:hypothetical protein